MGRSFEGKVAVVTGAARGMGRAVAEKLAEGGAAVVVNDVREDVIREVVSEIERQGGRAMAYCADVTNYTQVQAMFRAAVDAFGRVDILVNNAGILRATKPLETIPEVESGSNDGR